MFVEAVTYPAAFLAGLLSFFSPCILPIIPSYFTFITGFSLEELTIDYNSEIRRKVFFSTVSYVLGFSFVFILMGASASFLGNIIYKYSDVIRITGGVLIIILGIHLTGLIRIPYLFLEKRVNIAKKPAHFLGTFIIGMAFAAGWTPCIGPLLGSILVIASNQETVWQGVILLSIYSLGLAIPFVVISIFINFILKFIRKVSVALKYVNIVAGIMLIFVGLFLVSNKMYLLTISG
ncbi:MAG: cytochrome c biogenesis protein CcdA, partial [Desulfobacteraceae bacterium]|nr:cytochrome c biogenesis protein CcdA [Desulfobacteraceae bacterium]